MGEIISRIEKYVINQPCDSPRYIQRELLQLGYIKDMCNKFPTCNGCPLNEKYIGCLFRQGKTPKEW